MVTQRQHPDGDLVVAVDLGGTHLRAAVVDGDGTIRARRRISTPHDAPTPEALIDLVHEIRSEVNVGALSTVVAVPGSIDYREQALMAAPNLPASWIPLLNERWLATELGSAVALANDADLATVGETWFGAGRGSTDVAFVTISTGVGAGAVVGGRLVRGRWSGLEIGHTVIDRMQLLADQPATVETLGSGTALANAAAAAGLGRLTGPEIVDRVRGAEADDVALEVWENAVAAVGLGIVNLCWMLSPEVVVIGGGVGMNWDLVEPILSATLASAGPAHLETQLRPAALGDDAALVGAAAWAIGTDDG